MVHYGFYHGFQDLFLFNNNAGQLGEVKGELRILAHDGLLQRFASAIHMKCLIRVRKGSHRIAQWQRAIYHTKLCALAMSDTVK